MPVSRLLSVLFCLLQIIDELEPNDFNGSPVFITFEVQISMFEC